MSSELENQIKDDLFRDKVIKFFSQYKKYLITLLILLITIPSFYHAFKAYERNKSEKILEDYSKAIMMLSNENLDEADKIKLAFLSCLGRGPHDEEIKFINGYLGQSLNGKISSKAMEGLVHSLFACLDFRYLN